MTTIVLSDIHPGEWHGDPVFQTWNPLMEPAPEFVHQRVRVERALVDSTTEMAVRTLTELHTEADRRVWFCGSYANEAMTLQESAAASAVAVAERINHL